MTSVFVFILSNENWMYFQGKNIIFSLKYFDLDCVFISDTENNCGQGIPRGRSRPGSSCSSLNLIFRRKLRHDFIFGIPYSVLEAVLSLLRPK